MRPSPKHRAEGLDFDRVAQPRSGAVGFDVADFGGRQPGVGQGGANHGLLGRSVGGRQAVAASVVVDGAAANQGDDPIAGGQRVAEPFEHDHAAAFAADVAVGRGVEGLAAPVRGHHVGLGQRQGHFRAEHQVHPAGQGQVGFAAPQTLAGQVDGHQRRGAGGVQRDARTVQVQDVGQAIGENGMAASGSGEDVHVGDDFGLHQARNRCRSPPT